MDAAQAKVDALNEELKALREADRTVENSAEIVAKLAELKTAREELAAIKAAEEALAEADAADKAEADEAARLKAEQDAADAAAAAEAEAAAAAGGGEGEDGAGDGAGEGDAGEGAEAGKPVALAASAADVPPTGGDADKPRAPFSLTASSTLGNVNAGTSGLSREDMLSMLQASSQVKTEGRGRIMQVERFGPDAEVITPNMNSWEATEIIARARDAAQTPDALTAAACFCGPDEVKPDFQVVGDTARPFRNMFTSIPISGGGFRYYRDLSINPDSGSVNIWTCDDQDLVDAADPTTWKECSELDCFTDNEAGAYMITACTIVNTLHRWAHPYQIDRWIDKLQVEYAALAETALIDIVEADAGTPFTVGVAGDTMANYGPKAQLAYALASLSFAMGYQFRSRGLEGHVVSIPRALGDLILADQRLRGFDNGETRETLLRQVGADFGVRLVERLDESTSRKAAAAATVTALNAGGKIDTTTTPLVMPTQRLYIIRPDQWVHGEGAIVGADWHVDTPLLRQNKQLYFWENWELLERTGVEKAYIVDLDTDIRGAFTDLVAEPAVA